MKWLIYNLLFLLVFPLLLPGFLLRMLRRGGYAARLGDRFALYPAQVRARLAEGGYVWVHAVSVGEVQVAGQLMREWREAEPGVRFCFSTTSSTGWRMAEREVTERDVLIYNPLDFPSYVKSALMTARPRAIVLTASEIWPVFIRRARKMGIPLFLVNARVSDRSAPRYRLVKWWFADVFAAFTRIFAQSELDRSRLLAAGAPTDRVEVTGSFKFDVARRNEAKEREMREWIGPGRIVLGGSTWPGEDAVLLEMFAALGAKDAKLVIAPRHFEKADAVEANIRKAGFGCVRRSRGDRPGAGGGVYLADTTGELMGLYGIADVVFVGKSLCAHGSQNMIEPCLCGKPTVVGPYTENFRPVMSDLLAADAIEQVDGAEALKERMRRLFEDDGGLGARAAAAVERRRGVVPKCVRAIRAALCLALVACLFGCSKPTEPTVPTDGYVYEPVRIASAYIALAEKPDAIRATFVGEEAGRHLDYLRRAGVKCFGDGEEKGRFDIVFSSGELTAEACAAATERLRDSGVLVWTLDVAEMPMKAFRKALEAFGLAEVHLWMPGETRWLLVGRKTAGKTKLAAMLEVFAREGTFEDLAKARCEALPELFASYAGTREDLMAAFEGGDTSAKVRPEFFLTREVPELAWLEDDDVDADIAKAARSEMRSMQVVRRLAAEGGIDAAGGRENEAVDKWARAAKRNPNDLFILERLDRLDRNARGFLEVGKVLLAMKCYETMVLVQPENPAAVHNFGMCLKKIGKLDLAEKVIRHAEEMRSEKSEK